MPGRDRSAVTSLAFFLLSLSRAFPPPFLYFRLQPPPSGMRTSSNTREYPRIHQAPHLPLPAPRGIGFFPRVPSRSTRGTSVPFLFCISHLFRRREHMFVSLSPSSHYAPQLDLSDCESSILFCVSLLRRCLDVKSALSYEMEGAKVP